MPSIFNLSERTIITDMEIQYVCVHQGRYYMAINLIVTFLRPCVPHFGTNPPRGISANHDSPLIIDEIGKKMDLSIIRSSDFITYSTIEKKRLALKKYLQLFV